jgi:hypothetical protein
VVAARNNKVLQLQFYYLSFISSLAIDDLVDYDSCLQKTSKSDALSL